jgi:hypothetical protein
MSSLDRTAAIIQEILAAGEKSKAATPTAISSPAPPESPKS